MYLCEKCGKEVIEKFASGRFCSRKCANSRTWTEETKCKISIACTNNPKIIEANNRPRSRIYIKAIFYCKKCNSKIEKNKTGFCRNCYRKSGFNGSLLEETRKKLSNSAKLQNEQRYKNYINEWKQGNKDGWRGALVSSHIRKYLFEKYKSKCCKCGWNMVNFITGKIPLQVNHIDGHWQNNKEENLELLCPSCHSLTPNFMNLNKGNGYSKRYAK